MVDAVPSFPAAVSMKESAYSRAIPTFVFVPDDHLLLDQVDHALEVCLVAVSHLNGYLVTAHDKIIGT